MRMWAGGREGEVEGGRDGGRDGEMEGGRDEEIKNA